ncbi:hypothetical protein [Pseudomonas putida]
MVFADREGAHGADGYPRNGCDGEASGATGEGCADHGQAYGGGNGCGGGGIDHCFGHRADNFGGK